MNETEKPVVRPISQALLDDYVVAETIAAYDAKMRRGAEYAANVGLIVHAFDCGTQDATNAAAAEYRPLKSDRFVTTYLCDDKVERLRLEARRIAMMFRPVGAADKQEKAEAHEQIRREIQHWQGLRDRVVAGEEIPQLVMNTASANPGYKQVR